MKKQPCQLLIVLPLCLAACASSNKVGVYNSGMLSSSGFHISGEARLASSFVIPAKDGKLLSHAPAMLLSENGDRLIAATSEREIVVFENETQEMLSSFALPINSNSRDFSVSISPNGGLAAWTSIEGGTGVLEITSGTTLQTRPSLNGKVLALSPRGDRLAISRGELIEVRDSKKLELLSSFDDHKAEITGLDWSPEGNRLGSIARDGRLVVNQVNSGEKLIEVKKSEPLFALDFHPSGQRVAFGGQSKLVYELDIEDEDIEVIAKDQPYWITCLGYSPDGKRLAVGDESCDIWLFKVESKEQTFHGKHHVECWLSQVSWSPDGETFLFACRPNGHAGKPTVVSANTLAEAALAPELQQLRQDLLKQIDKEIESVEEGEDKEALVALKKAIEGWRPGVSPITESYASFQPLGYVGPYKPLSPDAKKDFVPIYNRWLVPFPNWDRYGFRKEPDATGMVYEYPYTSGAMLSSSPVASAVSYKQRKKVELSDKVKSLMESFEKRHKQEVKRLQGGFCVNQWKLP